MYWCKKLVRRLEMVLGILALAAYIKPTYLEV